MFDSHKNVTGLGWSIGLILVLVLPAAKNFAQDAPKTNENYCQKCHEPHAGLDYDVQTCLSCHESVPQGEMELYPWHSSEGAIAGLRCSDCHPYAHMGDKCLACHKRHTDPLRE